MFSHIILYIPIAIFAILTIIPIVLTILSIVKKRYNLIFLGIFSTICSFIVPYFVFPYIYSRNFVDKQIENNIEYLLSKAFANYNYFNFAVILGFFVLTIINIYFIVKLSKK